MTIEESIQSKNLPLMGLGVSLTSRRSYLGLKWWILKKNTFYLIFEGDYRGCGGVFVFGLVKLWLVVVASGGRGGTCHHLWIKRLWQ